MLETATERHRAGQFAEARRLYRDVLARTPEHPVTLFRSGLLELQDGHPEAALLLVERAVAANAAEPRYHFVLGQSLQALRRWDPAIGAYETALKLQPDFLDAWNNLGVALKESGLFRDALQAYDNVIALRPDYAECHSNRGYALHAMGKFDEAVARYKVAIVLRPDSAIFYNNLGYSYEAGGLHREACVSCEAAVKVDPAYPEAYNSLGNALGGMARLGLAAQAYRAAICLDPFHIQAYNNFATVLKDESRILEAIALYRRGLVLDPTESQIRSNLIMTLSYWKEGDQELIFEMEVFNKNAKLLRNSAHFDNSKEPDRPIKVGYVSGDLRRHPVGYFLVGVLANHDPAAVEIFCYSNSSAVDDMTVTLRDQADHWRDIANLSDKEAANRVLSDRIDILVDLSGHTARNRLSLFTCKSAPIQAAWLGYWGTTGLTQMDYLVSDAITVSPDQERFYVEKVARLSDGRFCYTPPDYAPEPKAAAAAVGQPFTFGSFNNLAKVGEDTIALWAMVLREVPEARLLLKWKSLADQGERSRIMAAFSRHGIEEARLSLRGASPHRMMLEEYGEVDVALDTHPFSGGVTTCEALWMGVPVVTLSAKSPQSRQTLSLLHGLGLLEWGAATSEDYVRIAARMARSGKRSSRERLALRQRMAQSPLCDGPRFAQNLEKIYRLMWREWCDRG